jgi:anti-anti-sigma factor
LESLRGWTWKELYLMQRHDATPAIGVDRRNKRKTVAAAPRTRVAVKGSGHVRGRPVAKPTLALAPQHAWTHTLILSGELDRRSVRTLEREMERLCEQGVTGITLDLRGLTYIDQVGVRVITYRCGLCERRGYDFALIRGSAYVQHAFETAGVADSLPFQDDDASEHPQAAPDARRARS